MSNCYIIEIPNMQREDLIKKWLDNDLSAKELEDFKKLEDYNDLMKLDSHLTYFQAPNYDSKNELKTLLNSTKNQKKQPRQWVKSLLKISAILVVFSGLYYYTTTRDTLIHTVASQKTTLQLPDTSIVTLNALSSLTYNNSNWDNLRSLNLIGEAFFKVRKGSEFSVNTAQGKVTVLGTQFNVKQRKDYFEVVCFEGSVKVTYQSHEEILEPGERFSMLDNKHMKQSKEHLNEPTWLNNKSTFKSIPYNRVLQEFERQYNVIFDAKGIDTSIIFTGNFSHNNLEESLQSITKPLNLSYQITNNNIQLKSD